MTQFVEVLKPNERKKLIILLTIYLSLAPTCTVLNQPSPVTYAYGDYNDVPTIFLITLLFAQI